MSETSESVLKYGVGGVCVDVSQMQSWRGPACFTGLIILTNVVSTLLSMAVGAVAPSNAVANVIGSIAAMCQILCGGFLLNKTDLTWVSYVFISTINYITGFFSSSDRASDTF